MRVFRLVAVMLLMFLTLGVMSAYANTGEGTVGLPILGTTGAPALTGPKAFSGVISVLYADGTPVVLEANTALLDVCGASSCTTVTATLSQTSPGTYAYSFTPPCLNGTVTIYVKAYALADDNGRLFPQIDTSIGSYSCIAAPTTGSSVPSASSAPTAGTPPPLTSQAVNPQAIKTQSPNAQPTATTQPGTQTSLIIPLLIVLSILAVAGCFLILPKRP